MIVATRSLSRFHAAQGRIYPKVVREIRRGVKDTHWMWFIFPQLQGLAKSEMAYRFGIRDREEADAYLANDTLRARLFECTIGVLARPDLAMFSATDQRKLRACMTLFREVSPDPGPLATVLEKFFGGSADQRTLDLLAGRPVTLTDQWSPTRAIAHRPSAAPAVRWSQPTLGQSMRQRDYGPWTRERINSFVRSFGLSTVATRQMVDAWMADQARARREGWEQGHDEGTEDAWNQHQR